MPNPHELERDGGKLIAAKQLDPRAVVDELTALNGAEVTIEVHVDGCGPAPRAILSGTVGALSMDDAEGAPDRGLVFVPVGAESHTAPGRRPGIYFGEGHVAWAEKAGRLKIALTDQTFLVIERMA